MHRIDTPTAATDLFGPGKRGFKDGSPLTGDPATTLNAAWFNSVQEELCGLVEAAGLTPGADNTQVLRALKKLLAPAGQIAYFAMAAAPAGWLKANGALVSRTTYADLFAAIGTTFGAGDGSTTFKLPDLRGEFVRGWDDERYVDGGRAFGSAQGDNVRGPAGGGNLITNIGASMGLAAGSAATGSLVGSIVAFGTTTADTRPRNVALLACIRT
ncbi:phage tail protein [Azospirillum argentinense]